MARWTARFGTFRCLNCSAETRGCYWQPGDTTAYLEDYRPESDDSCAADNRAALSACVCDTPHIEFHSRSYSTSNASVRASQRAVVYEFADGSWAGGGDNNDPMNNTAQMHARDGGIRREFASVRELRAFQRAHRKTADDEDSGYNEVIDWDESSLRHPDTLTRDLVNLRLRENRMREAFEMINFAGNKGRYEQALRELERRRR